MDKTLRYTYTVPASRVFSQAQYVFRLYDSYRALPTSSFLKITESSLFKYSLNALIEVPSDGNEGHAHQSYSLAWSLERC